MVGQVMSDRVTYRAVQCTITNGTRDAVCITAGPVTAWIPLSLIHGADELALRKAKRGDVITLRIMTWKVKALGVKSI
jgi:hypothetical protein